ncbi:hypothetical protein SSBR45G_57100 [Bradyrhizobium sp. SSBR45G]|uniref:hypothetical protein n=1 Tax=unclassified Bradyrhizobium TaxID=2631580 RepID=UPI0023429CFA|nr:MULTISPECIES: hypothetical protein [unclassified Bradyrhizobium]GLH80801.1 hypothetical protein SSBR45G_57100 [Bradyrhizobium sp. SSBR45G]GLH88160.1 hypothetical protein SSBR45R_56210 [Bradyrhizobium sp. SSBR45R]
MIPSRPAGTAVLLGLLTITAARAAEPSGCDKFKWDIARERAALTAADRQKLDTGAEIAALPASGLLLTLRPLMDAKLPSPPERAPKDGTFAGFMRTSAAPKAGIYTVSLSAAAWIDIVQDGKILKPTAFSGATDCEGIRKTVKYELGGQPFALQISSAPEAVISIAILPAE